MSSSKLLDLSEDVLVYILTFLSVPDILCMRQTCRTLREITRLSIIWINAWETQIFRQGYPFPDLKIHSISRPELEQRTRHAHRLAKKWLSESSNPIDGSIHKPFSPLIPHRDIYWVVSPSIPITDVRFIRSVRHHLFEAGSDIGGSFVEESVLVLSVSKGVWSVITIWEVPFALHGNDDIKPQPRKCTEWSPKGAIFTGLCLSGEHDAKADLAVSLVCDGRHEINLFAISDSGELLQICEIPSVPVRENPDTFHPQNMRPMKPMTLSGHVIAMSDDTASTVIYNWKTGAFAVLEHEEDEAGVWKLDHVIQVVFAYRSILVVRARSLHLFPQPELRSSSSSPTNNADSSIGLPVYTSLASHTFGWVDSVSVVPVYNNSSASLQPEMLKILVRLQSDDPWMANEHSLDLYELSLNPDLTVTTETANEGEDGGLVSPTTSTPYLFPPVYTSRVTSNRGSLRCTDLLLGKCGTAIWVKPGERATHGLVTSDIYDDYMYVDRLSTSGLVVDMASRAADSLVTGTFPGPLNPEDSVRTHRIYTNISNNWTALDYDEAIGRVVLGDAAGGVRILEL